MSKPLRSKDGKFAGSVGEGRTKVPTAGAPVPLPAEFGGTGTVDVAYGALWEKFKAETPATWVELNEASTQATRAIAVVDEEGEAYDPVCADARGLPVEEGQGIPWSSREAIADGGGIDCAACGLPIVAPSAESGITPQEAEFRRANDAYLRGSLSRSEWLHAVADYKTYEIAKAQGRVV